MELQYRMLGTDGKEYGPATLSELQRWIQQGRLDPQTQIWRTDQPAWRPAADFDELIWAQTPQPAIADIPLVSEVEFALEKRAISGASWFYWIAGLTAINTISLLSGGEWSFIVGLGITQVFDVLGREMGSVGMAVAAALDVVVIGIFALFGFFSRKHHAWAFITGMVLYTLDAGISLLGQDWLGLGFHGFALFCIFGGYKASRELKQIRAEKLGG
ncbi:MAG: DUF4339 domain-containing protein [Verrucomicrobia bacterium]|nr:DUF4339 domain-containing protein [Verrucomicrobiota bacterium]